MGSEADLVTQAGPEVRLGRLADGGVAPAIMAIVDRGVRQRPHLTGDLRAEVELDMGKRYPPVRIVFDEGTVLVEDGASKRPDLRVSGQLPDLVSLMVAPLVGGLIRVAVATHNISELHHGALSTVTVSCRPGSY